MKKYILICIVGLLSISCFGQNNEQKTETNQIYGKLVEHPEGTWKVDKEFDENGKLMRYDSIYSWSSDGKFGNLSLSDKDSLIQSIKARFVKNYSGFENVFSQDSLFIKRFFNDNFFGSNLGNDIIDIDNLRQQIIERQKEFLEKYQSEFLKPEDEVEN